MLVGLIPLFAVQTLEPEMLEAVFDHFVHKHELYVGSNHGIDLKQNAKVWGNSSAGPGSSTTIWGSS